MYSCWQGFEGFPNSANWVSVPASWRRTWKQGKPHVKKTGVCSQYCLWSVPNDCNAICMNNITRKDFYPDWAALSSLNNSKASSRSFSSCLHYAFFLGFLGSSLNRKALVLLSGVFCCFIQSGRSYTKWLGCSYTKWKVRIQISFGGGEPKSWVSWVSLVLVGRTGKRILLGCRKLRHALISFSTGCEWMPIMFPLKCAVLISSCFISILCPLKSLKNVNWYSTVTPMCFQWDWIVSNFEVYILPVKNHEPMLNENNGGNYSNPSPKRKHETGSSASLRASGCQPYSIIRPSCE